MLRFRSRLLDYPIADRCKDRNAFVTIQLQQKQQQQQQSQNGPSVRAPIYARPSNRHQTHTEIYIENIQIEFV